MKLITCPRSPSCIHFIRRIEVQAKTREIVDPQGHLVEVEDPLEMFMLRRFPGTYCAVHHVQATVSITS